MEMIDMVIAKIYLSGRNEKREQIGQGPDLGLWVGWWSV
jgi:hypothetical protein